MNHIEPHIPHTRDILQNKFAVIVDGGRSIGKDDLGGEHRTLQRRGDATRAREQVGHSRR